MTAEPPRPAIEQLPILILYPHSRCNCRCVMCDIWKTDQAEEISAAELERHSADLELLKTRWVVFSGGEPLMHSDLFRLAATLRRRRIRTTLLSTGLLLERYAQRIVENLDDVIVSLDGPPEIHDRIRRTPRAYDLLAAGVAALKDRDPRFPVAARSTVQRLNHAHLCRTVAAAKKLGLESISFLAADVTSTAFNRTQVWPPERQNEVALAQDEIPALESQIEALIRAHDPFVLETPEKLHRIVRHFQAHLGLEEFRAPRCNAPWVSAVVESDGTVRPCFFHPPIGNARCTSLAEVLNGAPAREFRARLDVAQDPTCRRCVCSLYLPETH
ncbi:MAG TPA: radical SAM protein [Bryobacteraceae bacterium]|nr:radical SAM protein [Bryobacteraceae bacterium]